MNELLRTLRKSPALLIGTAAVVGLALGAGVVPIPGLAGRLSLPTAHPAAAAAAPAAPPPPPDPLDSY